MIKPSKLLLLKIFKQLAEDLILTASISELDDQQITGEQEFSDINLNVDFHDLNFS